MTPITRKSVMRVSICTMLALAYFGALLTQPPGVYDEGLIVSGAVRILHGQQLYRDFGTGYPPGQFYTIASVFRIFGTTLLAERIWDTVWRLAIVGLAILLARAATPRQRPHPLPLICAGVLTGACGFRLYPMISAVLPCMAAVWLAVMYLNQRGVRWLFFSGIAAGAAVLYRHDLAACICGAVTVGICYQHKAEWRRRWLPLVAAFWAGVLVVVAMPALYFWLAAPHDALVQSFVDFPRLNLAARHLPLPGPDILGWRDFYLPLAVMLAAGIVVRRVAAPQKPVLLVLLLTSAATLALATQRLDTPHAYPAIMFSMVLLCACLGVWRLERAGLPSILLLSGAAVCYLVVPLYVWTWQMMGPRDAAQGGIAPVDIRRYSRNEPPNEILRAGLIRLPFDQREAVAYIQRHLPPGRPLYVGTTSHSLEFYNDAMFYFLADRPPATRFDMFVPGVTTGVAVQSEILRDLREKQAEYVVLFRAPASREPNLSSVDSGVTILDQAIRQDYNQVAEFGQYTIWRRADS